MTGPCCRFCAAPLRHVFVDLGMSPLCETFLLPSELDRMEPFYPLKVWVCERCFLVQLQEYVSPAEIFTEYAYFSSYSSSWLRHARDYTEMAIPRFGLGGRSRVVEIASNDGYLLQHFVEKGIPVLGVEPAANVARAAVEKGVPTVVKFFGRRTAEELAAEHGRADLIVGNNVLAHVPDINDFVGGLKILLDPRGVVTMEFPHLWRLIDENQFDTIYHEHFSYLSFSTVRAIFEAHGLRLFDVDRLSTHGGSLRVYAGHAEDRRTAEPRVAELLAAEEASGFRSLERYLSFAPGVEETKRALLEFLIEARRSGRRVAAYGAPGKGNTLLNYCGIRSDFVEYAVDRNPYKHGRFTPGTHIPIHPPEKIRETRPDLILILPWNLKDEIVEQLAFVREWGGRFVVPIPRVTVIAPS
ncbi:MAG TPA: class I SAM-dependent methyltransferase [Thermoanaerobaculia bacterium]|nr:class I SAM-dependent methyltransferase [Thermoanaerobaculia bacterium]